MINWFVRFLNGNTKCSHDWEIVFVDRITFSPKERRCKNCGAVQVAHTSWAFKCQK